MTMQKRGQNKKRSLSASKNPSQGGAGGAVGNKRKAKLTPDYVVSLSKDAPSIILQSASDLAASLSGGSLQRLDESTRFSARAPKCIHDVLQKPELDLRTKYAEVKGLNATEIDNMIIALPGDQEAVAYLMPFSVISGSRHLDLLVGTLHQTNKTLSKMTGGRALESKQN